MSWKFGVAQREISNEEILEDIRRVWLIVGQKPSRRQYDRLGKFGKSTVEKRFKTWSDAVEMAGLYGDGVEWNALEVWRALRGHGWENPVLSREIARTVGIREEDVRKTIARLVIHYHKPIGSRLSGPRRGFYILASREDFEREIAILDSRIRHIAWRLATLKRMKPSEVLQDLFGSIDKHEPL